MILILPEMARVEVTRWIKDLSPRRQNVVPTSNHDHEHIIPAHQAGAISYALEDVGMD